MQIFKSGKIKKKKKKSACYANKRAEFLRLPENFPRVRRSARLAVIFKSSLFAIRNGWFGHRNNQRLASVTT